MSNRLLLAGTKLADLSVATSQRWQDHRGAFSRLFCGEELAPLLQGRNICQINCSETIHAGTIRGLHFQRAPFAEMKLVRCLRGSIFDVAVDLRSHSPTFLHWHAETLSAENAKMMIVPEGFAHGFQTLADDTLLLYLHTAFYHPPSEAGLQFSDPRLAIEWPLPVREVSERDAQWPLLTPEFLGA